LSISCRIRAASSKYRASLGAISSARTASDFERRYDDVRRTLNESPQRSPNSSRSLFLFAVTLINQGKNHEAEAYLRRAIAIQPDNARYRVHLGAAELRDNRPAEAQEAFRQAIRLKPDYALPHYELGKQLAQSGHPHDALQELETAIQYEPGLVHAYYQLSRLRLRSA